MIDGAVRHGIIVAVIALIALILGTVGALNIPVQMIPDLEVRTISVETGWPGATPQDIEKEILIEQERFLRGLPNLQRMVSYAEFGSANIELEFPFGVDVNDALIRVNNALSQVPAYPENVDQPRLFSSAFSSAAFLRFRLQPQPGNPLQLDVDLLRDFAEDYIRPRLESVEGVSDVEVSGGAERQIQINVDPARLAQRGLRYSDVRNAVRTRNRDASAGDMENARQRFLLRVVGRFEDLSELEELIVSQRGNATIRLRDIAEVRLDHFETRSISYANGERGIGFAVKRESGSNVLDIKRRMMPLIEEINADLLARNGMVMFLSADDVQYVESSLANVWTNLALGALLATLVMYLFLRSGRATLIGVMGIPICTIAAFMALQAFGRTINVISLAGVAFAIGMTVDNTIVVLESVLKARVRTSNPMEAAVEGVRDVWPAVLASTSTTVLVFAPILFVEQEAGQLYSDVAIAISGAIIASMLVAVYIVPPALARSPGLETTKAPRSRPSAYLRAAQRCVRLAEVCCASPQRSRTVVAATLAATLGLAWLLMPAAEYLPEGEEPKAFSTMIAPPSYNLSTMAKIGEELLVWLEEGLEVSPGDFREGRSALPPLEYYSISISIGRIWVLSAPQDPQHIQAMMDAITAKFRSYEEMRAFSSRGSIISSNDGGTRAIAVDIAGPDTQALYRAAEAIYAAAAEYFDRPQLNSNPGSLSLDQPLVRIKPRWQRLADLGLSYEDFSFAVAAVSDGAFVDEFILGDDKIDIFLFSSNGNRQELAELSAAPFHISEGRVLPLNALADLEATRNSDAIRRVDGKRTVTVYIIPPREVALEIAEARVRGEMLPALWAGDDIAQGIKLTISGAADQLETTRASLSGNFLISLLLSYLLLVAIFRHWTQPLYILATVPLGMAGGLLGLIAVNGAGAALAAIGLDASHQPFDMITMLGFLILLGTVVNNPILVVDQTVKLLREEDLAPREAILQAVQQRLRPILMSTCTTLLGLAPLVFIPGEGTELYRGVGIIVLSGIFASTILTLTFLPALLNAFAPARGGREKRYAAGATG